MKCTTSIFKPTDISEFLDYLPTLNDLIKTFQQENFEAHKDRIYKYKICFIDILRQASKAVLGGKESLFRIHLDNESKKQSNVAVSVIVSLTKVKSKMKIVG